MSFRVLQAVIGLSTVLISVGCGGMEDPSAPRDASPASIWSTCDFRAGASADYLETASPSASAELRIFAIHEATTSLGDPAVRTSGEARVHVDRSVPTVLVLSAHEPTHWVVTADAGLEKVLLDGFHRHTVTVPDGVLVENLSGTGHLAPCGYADEGECRRADLVAGAEAATGLPLTGFVGCRYADELGVYDPS